MSDSETTASTKEPEKATEDGASEAGNGNNNPEAAMTAGSKSNINPRLLQKFQALQKRREELSKKSSKRRREKQKEEVADQDEDADARQKNVSPPGGKHRKLPSSEEGSSSQAGGQGAARWQDVQGYIDVNRHLSGLDKGRYTPKSGLEEQMDKAIAVGDFEAAESLSDRLANREFGKKIADAIDAKSYDEKQKVKQEQIKARKKKKMHWGFDHKQRWETKGNM